MDARELVQIAIALTKNPDVSVRDITLTIEDERGLRDLTVHSNGDLLRPLHLGDIAVHDADELIDLIRER